MYGSKKKTYEKKGPNAKEAKKEQCLEVTENARRIFDNKFKIKVKRKIIKFVFIYW